MQGLKGKIILVGSGPGDPGLITVKGRQAIEAARVLVYDYLAPEELLEFAPPDCEKIYVGKKAGCHTLKQDEINRLLVEKALEGRTVVRLKGGDPFVFGRGGEEALAAVAAGVEFEVIPGVTAGVAVPAYAGIPVTHRGLTSTLTFITGHEDSGKEESDLDWPSLAAGGGTLVFYMGIGRLGKIADRLLAHGRPGKTPVAVIHRGTTQRQKTVVGSLKDIEEKVKREGLEPPALIVVGEVVGLREKLSWFEKYPLFGRTVIVTRAREQASDFTLRLQSAGARIIELPTIRIGPCPDPEGLERVIGRLSEFDWIIFTSANGVKALLEELHARGRDVRALGRAALCAIGPATAEALTRLGLKVDLVPQTYVAESIVEALKSLGTLEGKKIFLPRAEIARKVLPESLAALGAEITEVPVYSTQIETPENLEQVKQALLGGEIDLVTFTSSSTVENFVALVGEDIARRAAERTAYAAIGPVTAEKAEACGLKPAIVPDDYTIEAMCDAICDYFRLE
ncbi:MAG TPA: uroporphyrinogen-III C-methyltransferase [Candidatus Glassbacteria bacterium]|nr:uroporphyrinogen-III C-methyltransferase [Candidatus Glassbacteria bacterium]